jgi:hypothetical protein
LRKLARLLKGNNIHLGLAVFWFAMVAPGLTILKDSLLFVILMSLYANTESSMAAWTAGRHKKKKPRRPRLRTTNLSHCGTPGLKRKVRCS